MLTTKNKQVHELIMEQFKKVKDVLYTFEEFLRLACSEESDMDKLRELCDKVAQQEAIADDNLRSMVDSLGKASYLPSTREDLIAIGTNCDAIANKCETICYRLVLQNFRFPSEYHEDLQEVITITHQQFKALENTISMLFSKLNELIKDHSCITEISQLESQIDKIEHKLVEKTYKRDIHLAEKQEITKFVCSVCDLADIIEDIADKILIMLVTRKA